MERIPPSERLMQETRLLFEGSASPGHPLDGFVRLGARLLIQQALEKEVADALGRGHYRHGGGHGWRNGYSPLTLVSDGGPLVVEKPKVRGTPFRSRKVGPLKEGSISLSQWSTGAYVRGLSTRDLQGLWAEVFGGRGLSKSQASRMAADLDVNFSAFRKRDLGGLNIAYLFLDGTYHAARQGTTKKEGILAAVGITEEGEKILIHLALGSRESYDAWLAFLHDMTARGLRRPLLVVVDGAPGLLKAAGEIWPGVPVQRCLAHRMRNLLAKVPKILLAQIKQLLHQIWYAEDEPTARKRAAAFAARYRKHLPSVVEAMVETLDECIAYMRFPAAHAKAIRTTNALERPFEEVRRRTKVMGRLPSEAACMRIVFASLMTAAKTWHGIRVSAMHQRQFDAMRRAQEGAAIPAAA